MLKRAFDGPRIEPNRAAKLESARNAVVNAARYFVHGPDEDNYILGWSLAEAVAALDAIEKGGRDGD